MRDDLRPGDFLLFQLEAGYGLLRLLEVDGSGGDPIWHLAAYHDLFADIDGAERAASSSQGLSMSIPHVALTNRAFESTQVSKLANVPLQPKELEPLRAWTASPDRTVSDRSIRLLMGLR